MRNDACSLNASLYTSLFSNLLLQPPKCRSTNTHGQRSQHLLLLAMKLAVATKMTDIDEFVVFIIRSVD
jgi:hypothetical protein